MAAEWLHLQQREHQMTAPRILGNQEAKNSEPQANLNIKACPYNPLLLTLTAHGSTASSNNAPAGDQFPKHEPVGCLALNLEHYTHRGG